MKYDRIINIDITNEMINEIAVWMKHNGVVYRNAAIRRMITTFLDLEPGQHIATVNCPCCGKRIRVEHGDDPGEIGAVGPVECETEATGRTRRVADAYKRIAKDPLKGACSYCGHPTASYACQKKHP